MHILIEMPLPIAWKIELTISVGNYLHRVKLDSCYTKGEGLPEELFRGSRGAVTRLDMYRVAYPITNCLRRASSNIFPSWPEMKSRSFRVA